MTLAIQPNQTYIYWVDIKPVRAVGHATYSLSLQTQWLQAKHPEEKQQRLQLTLTRPELQALREYIDRQLRSSNG